MNNDIYVGQEKSKFGAILTALIVAAVLIGFGLWMWPRHKTDEQEDVSAEPMKTQTAATPQAIAPAPAIPSSDSSMPCMAEAQQLNQTEHFLEARNKCFEILEQMTNAVASDDARKLLGELNIKLVLTPHPMPEKTDYTIQNGDSLALLAKKFQTTMELIIKGNNLKGSNIRVNDRLRIFSGHFSIKVDKSDNILDLYHNFRFFKRYRVGTGQYGKTPVGAFTIKSRVAQPTWWRADGKAIPFGDKENLLGTHWLSLDIPGYGIHGTWEPDTIGKQSSAGCIRLLNNEVEELYILVPEGTPVSITD